VSLIGTWMQQGAMTWLVYDLRHSALLLGAVGFASQIPTFLITPLAGVFTDRWNRHRTLMVTQSLALAQAALLTVLTFYDWVEVWSLLVLRVLLGVVNAFDIPTRQAFLTEMVGDPNDRANAIALKLKKLREHIRPIYVRAGILPEIAEGVEAASELASTRRG
jgi:MFS family permease